MPADFQKDSEPDLPKVWVNVAMTADGKIAPASRHFIPFGSENDHNFLYELRSRADAVLSGARTVDLGDVDLGPGGAKYRKKRIRNGLPEYYPRVIASGSASLDPDAAIFKHRFSPIIVLTTEAAEPEKVARLREAGAEIRAFGRDKIDFAAALRWLKRDFKVNLLLCEGGGEINAALFEAGLVDELFVTVCPVILGGRTAPTLFDGFGFPQLALASRLELLYSRKKGEELFLHWKVNKTEAGGSPKRHQG
jgi:riboflavin-specific deaminase-like protein